MQLPALRRAVKKCRVIRLRLLPIGVEQDLVRAYRIDQMFKTRGVSIDAFMHGIKSSLDETKIALPLIQFVSEQTAQEFPDVNRTDIVQHQMVIFAPFGEDPPLRAIDEKRALSEG